MSAYFYLNNTENYAPKGSVLVLAPHPDDEVFGCGGAILRHLQQGDEVKVVIVTDGGFPVHESQTLPDYPEIRKQESLEAAKILGYSMMEFLDYPDGFLVADEKLIHHLLDIIEQFQPQNIYLPADTEIHPDHLALNVAGIKAVIRYKPEVNVYFYEIGQPLKPNLFLDISGFQPKLEQAMDCFISQLKVQDYKKHITALHAYRTYTLGKDVKFAEAYQMVKSNALKPGNVRWEQEYKYLHRNPGKKTDADSFPLISVIIRTMNRPELPEALESISLQTYPNLEVIVVDALGIAGLNLGERCGRFPLHTISENKPLIRPTAANVGLKAVKGEYFCFLDEDDLILPEHIFNLFRILKDNPAPAAYSNVRRLNSTGNEVVIYDTDFSFYRLLWCNHIPIHALLFKTSIIQKTCLFDNSLEILEDWDFLLQVSMFGDFVHLNKITGVYRDSNSSGVHIDVDKVKQLRTRVFEKWKNKLSPDQFHGFLTYLAEPNSPEKDNFEKKYTQEHQKFLDLENRYHDALGKIDNLVGSKSWKITEPIRKVVRLFYGTK